MKVKKGDNVIVIAGKDRGRKGKVMKAFPQKATVMVEGMNMRKKHLRARQQGEKGQVVEQPNAFSVSNVMIMCDKCGKGVRVGYRTEGKEKVRVCKKCGSSL